MIIIFTTSKDQTSSEVMRWLRHRGVDDVIRINSDSPDCYASNVKLHVQVDAISFAHNGRLVNLRDITAVWYRKGRQWLCGHLPSLSFDSDSPLGKHLRERLDKEQVRLSEYVHALICSLKPTLGSPSKSDINKLLVLAEAKRLGIQIPPFEVVTERFTLVEHLSSKRYITKPIADVAYLFDINVSNAAYISYTEELSPSALKVLPETLFPSLIQTQIDKQYEVRAFYMDGTISAMAIFSQKDANTRVDFRRYNLDKPNRTVPTVLSDDLSDKLRSLFRSLELNTGSVDFLVDKQGSYFFLEINPVGQFSMVSEPCNYYLERSVAERLMQYVNR